MDAQEKVITVVFLLLLGSGLGLLGRVIFADGKVDYCYVEYHPELQPPYFVLKQHRPWREDREVSRTATLDDAKKNADNLDCPLK